MSFCGFCAFFYANLIVLNLFVCSAFLNLMHVVKHNRQHLSFHCNLELKCSKHFYMNREMSI